MKLFSNLPPYDVPEDIEIIEPDPDDDWEPYPADEPEDD